MPADQIPIGKFSLITRLSAKALRCYDKRGLLAPAVKDLCTGYRYYTPSQIGAGITIKTLQGFGFTTDDIGKILAAKDAGIPAPIRELFEKRRREIRSEIHRLQKIEAILEEQGASLESVYMSLSEPKIKEVAPLRIVSIREKGVYSETITRNLGKLCGLFREGEAGQNSLHATGPCMALYHDGEYQEKDADIEVAIPITGRVTVSDSSMEVRTLPGGQFLTTIYTGPYQGLHEGWCRVYAYAEEHNLAILAPGREMYLNDPATVPEEELLTEIQVPLS